MERPEESDGYEELNFRFSVWEGRWWRRQAQSLAAAEENGLFVGLLREKGDDGSADGEENDRPLSPMPGFSNRDERTNYGSALGVKDVREN